MASQKQPSALEQELTRRLAGLPTPIRIVHHQPERGGGWYQWKALVTGGEDCGTFADAVIQAIAYVQQQQRQQKLTVPEASSKVERTPEGYSLIGGAGIPDVPLTRAQALALFRVVLADLANNFTQELAADSELDQISQIHRFHELRARLTSDEPVFSVEEVQEDRRAYDEACAIQAEMEQVVGTSWPSSLERACETLEEAEEALELNEEEEE